MQQPPVRERRSIEMRWLNSDSILCGSLRVPLNYPFIRFANLRAQLRMTFAECVNVCVCVRL